VPILPLDYFLDYIAFLSECTTCVNEVYCIFLLGLDKMYYISKRERTTEKKKTKLGRTIENKLIWTMSLSSERGLERERKSFI
jgi:hypothetical protein